MSSVVLCCIFYFSPFHLLTQLSFFSIIWSYEICAFVFVFHNSVRNYLEYCSWFSMRISQVIDLLCAVIRLSVQFWC